MAQAVRRGYVRLTDTIFALSSGRPPAGIAVVRISGPDARAAARSLAGPLPSPRTAALRTLRDGDLVLDRCLVLCFKGPQSATGEDVVEFHCHGGRAVVTAVENALAKQPGLRRAEPGEFTRRALLHGRIDLMQVEGLADLLEAETEAQRAAAMSAADGVLSGRVRGWLATIASLSAQAEALLDYAEDGDILEEEATVERLCDDIAALRAEMALALSAPSVERLKAGVSVVIAGPPNAGKSTLLNTLVGREAAIVSPIAGTTRDRVEAPVSRAGLPLLLVDTAGLTDTADVVEAIGVDRAEQAIAAADVLVWLGDASPPRRDAIWVHSRADAPGRTAMRSDASIRVSCHRNEGVGDLWDAIIGLASTRLGGAEDEIPMHDRQRDAISQAMVSLERPSSDLLIVAERLAQARRVIARLLGFDATDLMLDALFGRFCLGK